MFISKEICTDGVRPDGRCPIIIKVSHLGRNYFIQTSIYIKEKNWDRFEGRIMPTEADYELKNETIDAIFRRISGKIQNFLDNTLDRSLRKLLYAADDSGREERLIDLIRHKMNSVIALNTRRGYSSLLRYVERRFAGGPEVNEIDQEFANGFIESVNRDFSGREATKRLMFSRFNAVISHGRETGLLRQSLKIVLPPCSILKSERNLDICEIQSIFHTFTDLFSRDPDLKNSSTIALGIFVLDIAFQGIAPADLAALRVKDLQYRTITSPSDHADIIRTVSVRTVRKKTGRPVHIVCALPGIESLIQILTAEKSADDYLIPCFNKNKEYSLSQMQNRLANFFNRMAYHLNRALIGSIVGERRITYYYARHAFCNLADSLDIPRYLIQHLVGHRTSVLETCYLRSITPWEQAMLSRAILARCFGTDKTLPPGSDLSRSY